MASVFASAILADKNVINSIFILRVIMSELLTTIHVLIKHRLERLAFALVQNIFLSAIFILENFFAVFAMRTW